MAYSYLKVKLKGIRARQCHNRQLSFGRFRLNVI